MSIIDMTIAAFIISVVIVGIMVFICRVDIIDEVASIIIHGTIITRRANMLSVSYINNNEKEIRQEFGNIVNLIKEHNGGITVECDGNFKAIHITKN